MADIEKIIQGQQKDLARLAETQIPRLIGEAALRLLAQGEPLTVETLTLALRQPAAHLPAKDYGHQAPEAAIAALLDAKKPA